MKVSFSLASMLMIMALTQCKSPQSSNNDNPPKAQRERHKPSTTVSFSLDSTGKWIKSHDSSLSAAEKNILMAVNRTDKDNLKILKKIIIPSDLTGDLEFYLPFPEKVPALKDVKKVILFSYPSQTFGAYENGELVLTGPTNMGRKSDPTPEGLYYTNWKAEKTTSTFNDEWDLKWNFNVENKEGIGFHEYALPGYPASHSCMRLREEDAKFLYSWAEQWVLKGSDDILAKGTPVIVFGKYDFDAPKPWLQLPENAKALDLSASDIENLSKPYLDDMLAQQKKREDYLATKN